MLLVLLVCGQAPCLVQRGAGVGPLLAATFPLVLLSSSVWDVFNAKYAVRSTPFTYRFPSESSSTRHAREQPSERSVEQKCLVLT